MQMAVVEFARVFGQTHAGWVAGRPHDR